MEQRILAAIKDVKDGRCANLNEAARKHKVPPFRLRSRWKRRPSRSDRPVYSRKLSVAEERGLCTFLDCLEAIGLPATLPMIAVKANSILARHHDTPGTRPPIVSNKWTKRFLKRHPEYHKRKQKSINIDRKRTHDPVIVREFFAELDDTLKSYGISLSDIYNMDETGFMIGMAKDQVVILLDPKRPTYLASSTNKDYVTVVECVSGDGNVLPPFVALPGQVHMEDWYTGTNLDGSWTVAVLDTGYMNDALTLEWVEHFERHSFPRLRANTVLCYSMVTGLIAPFHVSSSVGITRLYLFVFHPT